MAIPCDGRKECKDGSDEAGCDISLKFYIVVLAVGLFIISILAGLLNCCHKQNKTVDKLELDELEWCDQNFRIWHEEEERGKKIAFFQGANDRRLQNQALIAFETSYHGSYARAILCIKVSSKS